MIAAHVTHEAVEKMGGIGAVIDGLVTCRAYAGTFERTVLIGPLLTTDRPATQRLGAGGKVVYSSLDNIDAGGWSSRFRPIERTYDVGIVYGVRTFANGRPDTPVEVEVLLVDVFRYNRDRLNLFKGDLFARFGIPSDQFENIWEYEQYVRLAEPACEALHAIGCYGEPGNPLIVFAHEYMGMPTALKAMLDEQGAVRTVFYGHEVASVRRVVETHPGHDLMFYNLLEACRDDQRSLEDFFPSVRGFFKHPLVKAARYCDAVFAVGEMVGREMGFLCPSCRSLPMRVVYNGIPADPQTPEQRREHRACLRQYAENLFGAAPDYVFTHVARPVLSKGIWRDLRVMHELEPALAKAGRSAVYFLLGTLAGQRRRRDVLAMERTYGWPVHHKVGYPDLCNGEETLEELFEDFNRHHAAIRAVLVNQFGWARGLCGLRMPEGASMADIRQGTDVEFGLSVYEPFGISQLEPLSSGAICLVSSVCGCVSLATRCAGGKLPANILEGNFVKLPRRVTADEAAALGMADRHATEAAECRRLARELARRLPATEAQIDALLESGWQLGQRLGWQRVVEDLFLPAVRSTCDLDALAGAK